MDDITTKPVRTAPARPKIVEPSPAPPEVEGRPTEIRHKLDYKIDAHGEKISELVFREPTGQDIVRLGSPMRLDFTVDEAIMAAQMSNLANVPPSTISQLKAKDWLTIQFALVRNFFAPGMPTG